MQDICPICSNTLLRHLDRREISWFCPRCRQKMPNLERQAVTSPSSYAGVVYKLNKVNNIQPTLLPLPSVQCQPQLAIATQPEKNITITQIVDEQSVIVNSLVHEEQKRLEVVDFIISQINSIIINEIANTELNITDKKALFNESEKLAVAKIEPNKLIKADLLKDSKLVLLYICQAIILRNPSILKDRGLQELKNNYTNLDLPTEQIICWLNLIKTAILDFIRRITFDVAESLTGQNIHSLDTEVANYFDLAIASIL